MEKYRSINKFQVGFTLIELSIALSIAALFLAIVISTGASRIESERIKTTYERISFIMSAIDQFVRVNNYLPCPANPEDTFIEIDYGYGLGSNGTGSEGDGDCGDSTTGANSLLGDTGGNSGEIVAGIVPVRDLGLSPEVGIDGWGNRITYVVDEDLTFAGANDGGVSLGYLDTITPVIGSITINNARTGGTEITATAAVVVISHGPNGHGAWPNKGGATRINAGVVDTTDEGENVHYSGSYNGTFVQHMPSSDFDDILIYRNKWQLAQ